MHRRLFLVIAMAAGMLSFVGPAGAQVSLEKTDIATEFQDFQSLNGSQRNVVLSAMGIPGLPAGDTFTWAKIVAWFIFGSVGFIAFFYGKKQQSFKPLFFGIALMAYPYFFNNTMALYGIGIGLCWGLYYFRD